ncbi:MAG: glycine--tRNA ligase [Mycoplasmataceae bacterium]|nr:glycine--tRNA ligase [Mycoplasmataceae bacterium]
MKNIVNHLKNSGFVFQSSEIYGGLSNTWDYGPLGISIINKIKRAWWKSFISLEINNVGLDSKILLNPKIWEASGHISNFSDPLIENKVNHKRYRADHIYEEITKKNSADINIRDLEHFMKNEVKEYDGSKTDWTEIKQFNLMFETFQGVVESNKQSIYLRPETAQGIFVNFNNIQRSLRLKLPFGVGQIGKSFRNEVTPGNFIFRTREFEQMELEFFTFPEQSLEDYNYYVNKSYQFIVSLGIKKESLKIRVHNEEELAHYSGATSDIEFLYPFGWGEIMGISHRGNYDLTSHNKYSNIKLQYLDPSNNNFMVPTVIEPSVGVDRLLLAILVDSYNVENIENSERIVLKIDKNLAPYKVAILPLVKKLSKESLEIYYKLIENDIDATFDETGSIGKRYRRQDSIGTYYSITFDYDSLDDKKITIRNRDTMEQERILISEIKEYIK